MTHSNPIHIPGNEPDAGDMSTEPGISLPDESVEHNLPETDSVHSRALPY